MSPYQHLFSTNAVLNVWRNLRNTRDQNDLLLSFHVHPDDARTARGPRYGNAGVVETTSDESGRRSTAVDRSAAVDGRSIGFVVPWRSMQAQKKELREKEKELADALVVLAGEVSFADLPPALQSSLTQNPLVQVRHLAAGLSRQMSRVEVQMADNEPFSAGKNLYSGGELIRKYLPDIETLFQQRPTPQRMIFELLLELKDLVYAGMQACEREVIEWDLSNFTSFEDLDEALVRAITPLPSDETAHPGSSAGTRKLLRRKASSMSVISRPWLHDEAEILFHLESLDTTAAAMSHLPVPITDFAAKAAITLRRTLPRQVLNDHNLAKRKRTHRCAEYARCMKWAGTSWRQGGGCRRGCKNEDEDPEGLPSWHSSSRWFDERGTYMVGGGRGSVEGKSAVPMLREI